MPPAIATLFETIGPITLMAAAAISVVFLFVLFMIMMCIVRKPPDTNVNKPGAGCKNILKCLSPSPSEVHFV